jgi:hypothetical protein
MGIGKSWGIASMPSDSTRVVTSAPRGGEACANGASQNNKASLAREWSLALARQVATKLQGKVGLTLLV